MLHCRQHGPPEDSAAARPEKLEASAAESAAASAAAALSKPSCSANPSSDARHQPADVADSLRPVAASQAQRAGSLPGSLPSLSHAEQQNSTWFAHHATVHAPQMDTEHCLVGKYDLSFGGEAAKQIGSARVTEDLKAANFRYCFTGFCHIVHTRPCAACRLKTFLRHHFGASVLGLLQHCK